MKKRTKILLSILAAVVLVGFVLFVANPNSFEGFIRLKNWSQLKIRQNYDYKCPAPSVFYENKCVDPIPPCLNPPENSLFCIDRIMNGQRIERYNFNCYPDWIKTTDSCVNPCDTPYIPINGKCINPYPPCSNPPANSVPSSCVDFIHISGSVIENYNFTCQEGYSRVNDVCVAD